mmetsp:Transcript_22697/g.33514  ORF Transcript_22697/g.33514 Transcript_22697/m.33514 type:complete len:265 (+) Transcript_22697:90-884(+)
MTDEERSSEEEELLRDMILDRDRTIDQLERRTSKVGQKIIDVVRKSKSITHEAAETRLSRISIEKELNEKISLYKQRISLLEKDLLKQNGGLHHYAQSIQEVEPGVKESSYVVRVQSQLCKAMHSMGILSGQLETVKQQSEATLTRTKATIHDLMERKTQIEVEIMNDLMKIDDENRHLEDKLKDAKKKFDDLRETMSRRDSTDEEDGDEEDDDDDEIDEDLLQELLNERKELIVELEEENMKRAKQIEALNEKLKSLNGERHR